MNENISFCSRCGEYLEPAEGTVKQSADKTIEITCEQCEIAEKLVQGGPVEAPESETGVSQD